MVKRKLDGTVDKSSADKIHKSDATLHKLLKIWRLAARGNRSYSRQAGSPADKIWARLET